MICTRGKVARITEVKKLIKTSCGNENQKHEVEHLIKRLAEDTVNDTSIVIPASIVVYQKEIAGQMLCEFDGMIIHPNRTKNQITFLEAKNHTYKRSDAKNCLVEKFNKLSIAYKDDEITIVGYDAYMVYSVQ